MTTSQDQVARLLAMVPYLQAHPGITVAETAEDFGISKKQLLADLNVLWMCGLPGRLPGDLIEVDMDAAQNEGIIHISNADYLTRPARFTPDEAVSLLVALQAVAEMATGEGGEAARSAAVKLSEATGQRAPVVLAVNKGDDQIRETLTTAIENSLQLRLVYDGAARGETSYPVVDPAELQMRDSVVYLQAWSVEREDWRTYRLDRIAGAEPTGRSATGHGAIPSLAGGWFDQSDGEVVLELAPSATWVIDYYPVREVEKNDDGSARVRFAVADAAWLDSLLLRLGGSARVMVPGGAGAAAAAAAQEAIDRTRAVFPGD